VRWPRTARLAPHRVRWPRTACALPPHRALGPALPESAELRTSSGLLSIALSRSPALLLAGDPGCSLSVQRGHGPWNPANALDHVGAVGSLLALQVAH